MVDFVWFGESDGKQRSYRVRGATILLMTALECQVTGRSYSIPDVVRCMMGPPPPVETPITSMQVKQDLQG